MKRKNRPLAAPPLSDVGYSVEQQARERAALLRGLRARRAAAPEAWLCDHRNLPLWQPLVDHALWARTRDGAFMVSEAWCNNDSVRAAVAHQAKELIRRGWRVAVLPSRYSTRWTGNRQPVVLVPPFSNVDPDTLFAALKASDYRGKSAYENDSRTQNTPEAPP
jgi:hypothetical protein